eukprot:PhF_6_TR41547/c0_g1_i1/m.62933
MTEMVDEEGGNALHYAASIGHDLCIRELLAVNPKMTEVVDTVRMNALHCAATWIQVWILRSRRRKTVRGGTCCIPPRQRDVHKGIRTLLRVAPAMINMVDKEGGSALHVAAFNGHDLWILR